MVVVVLGRGSRGLRLREWGVQGEIGERGRVGAGGSIDRAP